MPERDNVQEERGVQLAPRADPLSLHLEARYRMTLRAGDFDGQADPLGAFSSEADEGATHFGLRRPAPSKPTTVSLDDIVSHGTPVHWDEAVAVVEDLCDVLVTTGSEPQIPPLQNILIGLGGAVTLKQGPRGERGVQGAARILHALLSTASVPVALRLFVTQASSPESYASLRDFAVALAYFGKPLRVDLIRALYERHATGVASAPPRPAEPILRPLDTRPHAEPETKVVPPRKPTIAPWVFVAAGVLAVAAAGMMLWFSTGRGGTGAEPLPERDSQTKNAVKELPDQSRTQAAPAPDTIQRVAPSATKPRSPLLAPQPVVAPSREPTVVPLESLQLVPQRLEPTVPVGALVETQSSVDRADSRAKVVALPKTTVDDEKPPVIYSRTDTEVKPPVLVYPQLPAPVAADIRADSINSMEIVVGESGQVEQVRIVAGPRRMPDMMLLSGAKMWRFKPALKDGQPVRYRTIVSWSGLP